MKKTLLILALVSILMSPLAVFAATEVVPGDFKVIATENLGGGKVKVSLEAYHKLGAFSTDKIYEDRYAVPADLLGGNYIPVRREFASFAGKGRLTWEEMKREGYVARIILDKGFLGSGDVTFRLALILANDGTVATPGAAPKLVAPLAGVIEYQPGQLLVLKWDGVGPNFRCVIFNETHGVQTFAEAVRGKEIKVNTSLFGRNQAFVWTVQQADDGLAFGDAATKRFQGFSRQQLEWVTCRTCNGSGHIYVPDPPPPPPQPHKGQQICNACGGTGRVSEYVEHFFLDFNK